MFERVDHGGVDTCGASECPIDCDQSFAVSWGAWESPLKTVTRFDSKVCPDRL